MASKCPKKNPHDGHQQGRRRAEPHFDSLTSLVFHHPLQLWSRALGSYESTWICCRPHDAFPTPKVERTPNKQNTRNLIPPYFGKPNLHPFILAGTNIGIFFIKRCWIKHFRDFDGLANLVLKVARALFARFFKMLCPELRQDTN